MSLLSPADVCGGEMGVKGVPSLDAALVAPRARVGVEVSVGALVRSCASCQ